MRFSVVICMGAVLLGASCARALDAHSLSFGTPAEDSMKGWEYYSLPIGNGYTGASVFGIVTNERLQVTCNEVVNRGDRLSMFNTTSAFDIRIETGHRNVSDYRRALDFDTGIATVEYSCDGVRHRREYFASYPDRVIVMRLTASEKGALAFILRGVAPYLRPSDGRRGRSAEIGGDNRAVEVLQRLEPYSLVFSSRIGLETDGTVVRLADGSLKVTGATTATAVYAYASNYRQSPRVYFAPDKEKLDPIDPRPEAKRLTEAALAKGYATLRARHLADFGGLMSRVKLDLAEKEYERYFSYGRYLMASSSRPGTLPANLQGVWCANDLSPWGNFYVHNINVQMNYWVAFQCNLAECFEAYATYNAAFRPAARNAALKFLREYVPENLPGPGEASDMWCIGPGNCPYWTDNYPGGHSGPGTGGLTTLLFLDWWDYTLDRTALEKYVFPAVHGMADFLSRCVVLTNGLYLSKFSASPEQLRTPGGRHNRKIMDEMIARGETPYVQTTGCAFDQEMIHENNAGLLRLAEILGTNDAVIARVREQVGRYDPILVGESGQLKEYREEKKYGDLGEYDHRHLSQLVSLYPGTLVNATRPDWMAAARYSLTERGDMSTGWALAHRICCWARLGDGEHARKQLGNLLLTRTNPNLWDEHPPFQIDGNFGATAGIAEMLVQSQAGYIDLLPALPAAWAKAGSFEGLCARGGFEVKCAWSDGKPVKVSVMSKRGLKPDVRFKGNTIDCEVKYE